MSKLRLFVALNFPRETREAIGHAVAPLRAAPYPVRWVDADLIHLTVKFLGDVAHDRLPVIESALSEVAGAAKPFVLPLEGAGAFPRPRDPRVVWVGCEPVPALELLQHALEGKMQTLGFPIDGRPFRPHLTVGRVKRDAERSAFRELESDLESVDLSAAPLMESLDLVESTLSPRGPSYRTRVAARLGG